MVRPLEVPGLHSVPEAMDMDTLQVPPASHCWYEVPSEEQLNSPAVHEPLAELLDDEDEPELEVVPVPEEEPDELEPVAPATDEDEVEVELEPPLPVAKIPPPEPESAVVVAAGAEEVVSLLPLLPLPVLPELEAEVVAVPLLPEASYETPLAKQSEPEISA